MSILLTPARIGSVQIPNRIVMPPMTTRTADEEGYVTDDTLAYYLARARGGVGLITVEMASPEKVGRHRRREIGIHDDRFLPGLARLVDALHRAGSKVSIQLGHGGGHTRADICGEMPSAAGKAAPPLRTSRRFGMSRSFLLKRTARLRPERLDSARRSSRPSHPATSAARKGRVARTRPPVCFSRLPRAATCFLILQRSAARPRAMRGG